MLKVNACAVALKNYNLTYERALGKRFSFSLGYRYMPKGSVPFESKFKDRIQSNDFSIADFKMGNTAITPEFRLYMGRPKMRGFYLAPYARYATFDFTYPLNRADHPPILLNGKITSTSVGLLMGVQSNLSKRLVLDLWLIGGHYGKSKGTLTATNIDPAMTEQEQQDVQNAFNETVIDGPVKFEGKVLSSTSAQITSEGPWAGFRGLAIVLGYKF